VEHFNIKTVEGRYFFLFNGSILIQDLKTKKEEKVSGENIFYLGKKRNFKLRNIGENTAYIFSVENLNFYDFVAHSENYSDYPSWLFEAIQADLKKE
jgi:hypothetical protein